MKKKFGFTVIELLVIIAILGILAAMLVPAFHRAYEKSHKTNYTPYTQTQQAEQPAPISFTESEAAERVRAINIARSLLTTMEGVVTNNIKR